MSERLNNDLLDIEEIVEFGKKHECCPFYGARQALPRVDVAILPYQLLLVPSAREARVYNFFYLQLVNLRFPIFTVHY